MSLEEITAAHPAEVRFNGKRSMYVFERERSSLRMEVIQDLSEEGKYREP